VVAAAPGSAHRPGDRPRPPRLPCSISTTPLLNTYDYEIANQFGFTPPTNATLSTPRRSRRCSTCRIWSASRPATATRSSSSPAGRRPGHLFLKPGTRAHITSEGYSIMADFGDQYSDLPGGDAGHQVKIPNPMYYLP
jgi:hypothetical protein